MSTQADPTETGTAVNQTNFPAHTDEASPPTRSRRKTKLKITPGKVSQRPGQVMTGATPQRTLTISIPPAGQVGTAGEAAGVEALANTLRGHQNVGVVTASGINNNVWQIVMRLASAATATDEAALDAAFEVLVPVFNDCELLRSGFGDKKPRWRFSGHDQMDSGHF